MTSVKTFLILPIFLLHGYTDENYEVLSSWKLARESEDIKISYRNVEVGDTLKTREMRLSFLVDAAPDKIVAMFKEADKLTVWSAGAKECEILSDNNSEWLTYSKFNFPWPFSQEDLVTEYSLVKSNSVITLSYKAGTPRKLPFNKNIPICKKYEGQWLFISQMNGITKVEFYSTALFISSIPKFIQDPIVQEILIESINNLKTLIVAQESKRTIAFE